MSSKPNTPILATSLLLTLLLSAACPAEEPDGPLECGDTRGTLGSGSSNIVNGDDTWDPTVVPLTDGQALAVGAIMSDTGWGWSSICTGTVVAPTVVLTAAHCVVDRRGNVQAASTFGFGIGDNTERLRAFVQPVQVVKDPWYNARSSGAAHDQALLIFDTPLTAEVPDLVPIPFNRTAMNAAEVLRQNVQAVGFGCIDSNCDFYNNLRYWAVEELVDLTSFDLTIDGHGVAGVCFGDSGGPLLRHFPGEGVKVIGTLSYGDPDCGNQDHYCLTDSEAHFLDEYAPGCGAVTPEGSCAGNSTTYCENDLPITIDCSATDEVCQQNGDGLFRCVDPCGGETWQGRCDGTSAVWCEGGQVKTRRCAECGLSCGLDQNLGYTVCF
ncbi:MAG: trypsin-like serine protease [Deltaproteobacteria bacterium]|nr:trypsin-like serine protease [Deltaproteobacteria bacterium]